MNAPIEKNHFSMDHVAQRLTELGLSAYVEHTGGGCATIYAGPTHVDPDWGQRYAVIAGPGWFDNNPDGTSCAYATSEEFFFGHDDDGETSPTAVTSGMAPEDIARAIADWARVNA